MLSLLWEFILVIFRKCFPMFPLWFHNLSNTHYFFSYLQGLGGNEVSVLCSSFLCIWKFWSCLLKSGVFLVCSFGNKTFSQYFLVLYFFFFIANCSCSSHLVIAYHIFSSIRVPNTWWYVCVQVKLVLNREQDYLTDILSLCPSIIIPIWAIVRRSWLNVLLVLISWRTLTGGAQMLIEPNSFSS